MFRPHRNPGFLGCHMRHTSASKQRAETPLSAAYGTCHTSASQSMYGFTVWSPSKAHPRPTQELVPATKCSLKRPVARWPPWAKASSLAIPIRS